MDAQEIVCKRRAEFDHLWEFYGRDEGFRDDKNLLEYAAALENLILNRLDEAGLQRGAYGSGLVGWKERYAKRV